MAQKRRHILTSFMLQFFVRTCLSGSSDGTYFVKTSFHKLEGSSIGTNYVEDIFRSVWSCLRLPECSSVNIADQPNKDGLYECVLLREVTCQSLGLFRPSKVFHHYTPRSVDLSSVNIKKPAVSCNTSTPLGMKSGAIPDESITASSEYHTGNYPATQARLDMKVSEDSTRRGAWEPNHLNANQWLQIDFGTITKVTDVATQGSPLIFASEWVTSYSLQYSMNDMNFENYEDCKIFAGNSDRNTIVKHALKPAIIARYIRFRPKTWRKHIALRVELYGCR